MEAAVELGCALERDMATEKRLARVHRVRARVAAADGIEVATLVTDLLLNLGLVVATIVAHCAVVRGLARSVVLVEDADDVVGKAVFAAIRKHRKHVTLRADY